MITSGHRKIAKTSRKPRKRVAFDPDVIVRAIADLETVVLNSDEIYVAGEIFSSIHKIIPDCVSFDFLFRERRRFPPDRLGADPDWLYFPYLSFSLEKNSLKQFASPDEIKEHMNIRYQSGKYLAIEQTKFILFVPFGKPKYFERIAKRCAKLVTAFYYASGPHDHFTANIARRHISDYLRTSYSKDPGQLNKYIEEKYDVQVAYIFQTVKDEAFEGIASESRLLTALMRYTEFREDLRNALRRKASFLGRTSDGLWHYSIHSFVEEPVNLSFGRRMISRQATLLSRRGFAVVGRQSKRLPLDIVKVVPALFDAHRAATRIKDRDDFFRETQKIGQLLEDEIAATPPESIETFQRKMWTSLRTPLQQILNTELVDWCQIFVTDPFKPCLQSVLIHNIDGYLSYDTKIVCSLVDETYLPWVRAINENTFQYIPNIESEVELQRLLLISASGADALQLKTRSLFAAPVTVGRLQSGAVVVGSRWPNLFDAEIPYLESIAKEIGNFIHRMELVADISWLSRISFLHSARHELENFRRRLKQGEDRDHFEKIMKMYSGLHRDTIVDRPYNIREIVERCLARYRCKSEMPKINLMGECDRVYATQKDGAVVSSIIDQLISNARAHSLVENDPFCVTVRQKDNSSTEAVISIEYRSSAGKILKTLLSRVCVAPIPDENTSTYHFGLFLCAVQVRMLGGKASARQDSSVDFKKTALELAFEVPISTLPANDGLSDEQNRWQRST